MESEKWKIILEYFKKKNAFYKGKIYNNFPLSIINFQLESSRVDFSLSLTKVKVKNGKRL